MTTKHEASDRIAKVIADALTSSRRTQADLAREVGVGQPTVHKWVTGSPPHRDSWAKIEGALDLAPGTFAGAAGMITTTLVGGIDDPMVIKAAQDLDALPRDKQRLIIELIRNLAD